MLRASGEVVSSVAVTRFQAMSRSTRESVASLQAWDNAPGDQFGEARLPLSFGLADVVQFVNGRHPSDEVPNPVTDMVYTLASKVLHTPLFMAIEWSSPKFHLAGRILEGKASSSSLTVA